MLQIIASLEVEQGMNVIGHDTPADHDVSVPVEKSKGIENHACKPWIAETAAPAMAVQLDLTFPNEASPIVFGRTRILPEATFDVFDQPERQRIEFTKGDEIDSLVDDEVRFVVADSDAAIGWSEKTERFVSAHDDRGRNEETGGLAGGQEKGTSAMKRRQERPAGGRRYSGLA
ncbi:MAG TPA: hypothetical protein VM557_04065 [Thermoanaerobaculia bacterium]|nr:hypothetical protein [Thermoanaerobaculia bacterium]